jgi:serine/threonine protein kinase
MTVLSQRDLFPLIAEAIRKIAETKHDWARRDEIVDELLLDAAVRDRLAAADKAMARDPRWYVGNAVDWFSQKYTAGDASNALVFERTKLDGKWAYRPVGGRDYAAIKSYRRLEELGRGGFGVVYKGEVLINGQSRGVVAIKTYMGAFDEAEYELLRGIDYPNIIGLIDRYDDKDLRGNSFTCMVLEFADGGSLGERIRAAPQGLPSHVVWRTVASVARALDYLHSMHPRVLHRDVKPENILYCHDVAKLSDVGIAKLVDTTTVTHSGVQTLAYAAPEMFPLQPTEKPVVSPKTDIYALGLTAFEALVGNLPWPSIGVGATIWHHHNSPLPRHTTIPRPAQHLLEAMTAKDYNQRWTAAQVADYAEHLR